MPAGTVAQYHGRCVDCDEDIVPGQRIEPAHDDDTDERAWQHVDCNARPETAPCTCEKCFLVHAGECF